MRFTILFTALISVLGLEAQVITPPPSSLRVEPKDDGFIPKHEIHAIQSTNRAAEIPFVRFDDVMWSTRHYEIIQVHEKINHPLYYPEKPLGDRKSLWDIIVESLTEEGIFDASQFSAGYVIDGQDKEREGDFVFGRPMSHSGIMGTIYKVDSIFINDDRSQGLDYVTKVKIESKHVVAYKIKTDWYFDKQRGEMRSQIIGICPVVQIDDPAFPPLLKQPTDLFWIFFPALRDVLAQNVVYNPSNNAKRLTFDQLFQMRYFNSRIYKEDNVYDRMIAEYKHLGRMGQLLESQRIREELRDYEGSLWQF